MNFSIRRGLLAACALALFLPAASAQDRPARGERLAEALSLTDAQASLVADALSEAEPGALWALAADLTPTLTAEQKDRLFAPLERADRMRERRSGRRSGERPDRMPRRERSDTDARDAVQAEMQTALNLTDAQVQQLGALHAEREAEREQRRAAQTEPGELPADLAAVLTPEQQEIALVHRALAARLMQHRVQQRRERR